MVEGSPWLQLIGVVDFGGEDIGYMSLYDYGTHHCGVAITAH